MTSTFFAACAPGLEPWLARELASLHIADPQAEPGGVTFEGEAVDMARVCLHSGLANHLRLRVGEPFSARRFEQLQRKSARLPWAELLPANARVDVHATCRKSRLYHSKAVAERVVGAITAAVGEPSADRPQVEVVVRIIRDQCTVSLDVSGEALHRRGWRQQTAKAPLREDLARALLVVSGWEPGQPLFDPMMGSGTVVIEAATMARSMAPGRGRRFAFDDLPIGKASQIDRLRAEAEAAVRDCASPLFGSDNNPGALKAALGNAARAGVADDVQLSVADVRDGPWPSQEGAVLVTNPPYGLRVARGKPLRALYARLGERVRERGWEAALIMADARLADAMRLPLEPMLRTSHGGIDVTFMATDPPQ